MSIPTTSQTHLQCEGPCCCRCHLCKSIGYWSSLNVTIPVPVAYPPPPISPFHWGMEAYWTGGPRTHGVCLVPQILPFGIPISCSDLFDGLPWGSPFGSGFGTCSWIWSEFALPNPITSGSTNWRVRITLEDDPAIPNYPDGMRVVLEYDGFGGLVAFRHIFRNKSQAAGGWNCYGAGTFTWESSLQTGTLYPPDRLDVDFTGTEVTVSLSEESPFVVWQSCGMNPDGSPVEDPGIGMESVMGLMRSAIGPAVRVGKKSTPLPVLRPDRCEHLGKRTEHRGGCNGWKCSHNCDLGLNAVPGGYCQTCQKYEIDLDYAGKGPSGWMA